MRKLATALAIGLLAGTSFFAVPAEPARAGAAATKVVIVVGPVQSLTSSFRAEGDRAYAEAIGHTSNVVYLKSPNATWSAVKAAATGANIVVYIGHGNGEPSPYHPNLVPGGSDMETVDGMGLNSSASGSNYNVKYYGEKYVMTLDLAPHAAVLIWHACYSAGGSEPKYRRSDPVTWAKASHRVDNFAAGFIHAGAEAVLAESTYDNSIAWYIHGLFERHTTIGALWNSSPTFHGNVTSWQSSRNPTYLSQIDPEAPTSGYYRSMVSIPSLQTDDVISGATDPFVSQSGTYFPLSPTRVIDTRGNGVGPAGFLMANGVYTFQVAGVGGVPSGAIAITGNLTVTGAGAGGYVYLGPNIWSRPTSSTINFPGGDDRANGVTVPLSDLGQLQAYYAAPTGRATHMILDVTGYFLPGTSGKGYVAFGPKRILDTRPGDDNVGLTGKFQQGVSRQILVAGVGGLPDSGITAVVGNITAVNPTAKGYVFLGPDRSNSPTASTINFPAGDIRANNFVVPVNADGTLSAVYWTATYGATTDLVLDISGYFTDSGGALYHTLDPARIMDSRNDVGVSGAFAAGQAKTLAVTGAGGVPSGAIAITANLTVTGQTSIGFGAVGPTITPDTKFSNLNFPTGDNRANGVTVPLNADGTVQIVDGAADGSTSHFIIDVCGYYLAR